MSDDLRSLREHLADERLYAGAPPAASAHPAAWRASLLARYPDRSRRSRPADSTAALWRLILLVALPLAVATTIALLAMAGVDLAPRFDLPVPSSRQLADLLQVPRYVWYGLAALSALLTFLVRGRVPRLLPVDW